MLTVEGLPSYERVAWQASHSCLAAERCAVHQVSGTQILAWIVTLAWPHRLGGIDSIAWCIAAAAARIATLRGVETDICPSDTTWLGNHDQVRIREVAVRAGLSGILRAHYGHLVIDGTAA